MKSRFLALILFLTVYPLLIYCDEISILSIDSYSQHFPWTKTYLEGLDSGSQEHSVDIQFYIEYLDSTRLQNTLNDTQWLNYLAAKYADIKFDMILANSNYASAFAERNNAFFGQDIPIIYYSSLPVECSHSNEKHLTIDIKDSVNKTVDLALKLNPEARDLYLIQGIKYDNKEFVSTLKDIVANNTKLNLTIITAESIEKMLTEVQNIPSNAIVFYTLIMWDRAGRFYVPREIMKDIVRESKAPVYSFWSALIGTGTVGGEMIDSTTIAKQMINAGLDYIYTGAFKTAYPCTATQIDWSAVIKHDLNQFNIPQNAFVRNKPPSLWDTYNTELMTLSAIVACILLAISFIWSRKLRMVNIKLKALNYEVIQAKNKAEQEARTDTLTGLNNRLAFFEKGVQVCKEIRRLEKPVALLMLDIDDFKHINDTFGHDQGDRVIVRLAEIINETKREIDIPVRFGGEEFIVVLPFSDAEGAALLAERIRHNVEINEIKYKDKIIQFTVSIGVFSTYPKDCDLNKGLKNADDAMYKAKSQGKNQICIYSQK